MFALLRIRRTSALAALSAGSCRCGQRIGNESGRTAGGAGGGGKNNILAAVEHVSHGQAGLSAAGGNFCFPDHAAGLLIVSAEERLAGETFAGEQKSFRQQEPRV